MLWLFIAALAWTPFWYGSNDLVAWGVNAVIFPALAALLELRLLIGAKGHPVGMRALAFPVGLFALVVAWIIVQTVTLAPAPPAHPIWALASDALGRPVAASISVERNLTLLALVRLITAASVFWLALQLCRNAARANLAVDAIMAVISLYAAYGVAAFAVATGRVPWSAGTSPASRVTAVSSTFVNHNSFAAYVGLGLIAACATLYRIYEREIAHIHEPQWRRLATIALQATGHRAVLLIASAFVLLVALLLTGSRGGIIATGIGLCVLAGLAMWRAPAAAHGRRGILILAALVAGATVFAFGDPFAAGLAERGIADTGRMAVYLITIWSILDAPLLGHGYGTFADVFPMYRDRSISTQGVWQQAHDTYLEVFQGLGLVFGCMLVACVLLLVVSCLKGAATRQESVTAPRVAASAAFLVGVHSLVDFSLQIQAIALTFMALLGAGVAQSSSSRVAIDD